MKAEAVLLWINWPKDISNTSDLKLKGFLKTRVYNRWLCLNSVFFTFSVYILIQFMSRLLTCSQICLPLCGRFSPTEGNNWLHFVTKFQWLLISIADYPCAFKCVVSKLLTAVHSHQALVSCLAYRQPTKGGIHSASNVNEGQ